MILKISFRPVSAILACVAVVGLCSCASWQVEKSRSAALRQQTLIDADWMFHRGDVSSNEQVIAASYDDAQWQRVQLPHDYVLDGSYKFGKDKEYRNQGYLPLEVAWYRKRLFIPQSDQGKKLQLQFDGVYRDSQVWLNGQYLGNHPSGFTGFYYDITKAAKFGADNLIVVRTDPRQTEGHWYEGGGIYRHVYYTAMDCLHVANYGTCVTSTVPGGNQGADAEAQLNIQTTVENSGGVPAGCAVVSEIFGPDGKSVKILKTVEAVSTSENKQVTQKTTIDHPQLWSLESPNLYKLHTTILKDGQPVDSTLTTFGIRTIRFDVEKGFFLNGNHVKIYGAAMHQDFPAVGIAMPDSLQPWRVKKLKEMGCNGWRTAHNEPTEAVLDACDQLGMLVMAENRHLGDSYRHHSQTGVSYTNLSDLATMIQRDRNHPSIIMWSLCNEEGLQGSEEGIRIFSAMMKKVRYFDQTRPISSAISGNWIKPGFTTPEELAGVNYHQKNYDEIRRNFPTLPMYGSESANSKSTRCEYENDPTNGWVSSYNLTDDQWEPVASRPFMAGAYVWTGFDYKGEPNPYGWPDVGNHTGLMDLCGFPKDKYYYFQSWWPNKPMVHIMPMTWNWPGQEGKNIRVIAFSNARQVELFLNGKSLGIQTMPQYGHVEWQVPYQPGCLMAKGYTDGKLTATDKVETTDAPALLQLSPDRKVLHADGQDTIVVPVSILDAKGRVVPYSTNRVTFTLTGRGKILGVGNGNPSDHDPDRAKERNAFHGHCIVLIQAGSEPEKLELTATSPALKSTSMTFQVR